LVDVDLPVVDRGLESGHEHRLQDHAEAGAVGLLRLQAEIALLNDAIENALPSSEVIQYLAGTACAGLEQLTEIGRANIPGAVRAQAHVRNDVPRPADFPGRNVPRC